MNKQTLILTVGLSNSGKSTWAKTISEKFNIPIVEPDAIRRAIHGQEFLPSAEYIVWSNARTMVRSLFETGYSAVLLDSTMMMSYRRKEWSSRDWDTVYVHVSTPAEVCVERATKDGRYHLIPVINRMAKQFELPNDQESTRWFDFNDLLISKNMEKIVVSGMSYSDHKVVN